jgi:hypothetical protein
MKTKLEMAHEFMLAMIKAGCSDGPELLERAWQYADAMQAEADKRECKERTDVLLTKDKDGNCLHSHHEFGYKKCMDCGASLEEWQPDWSQAPKNMNYFFVNKDGSKFWTINEPDKPNLTEHVMNFSDCGGDCYAYASLQDYQGDWRESLRKRPQ